MDINDSEFRFEVAVSFAGDKKRDRIRRIMEILVAKIGRGKVFFDEWFESELAGHDGQIVLQNIYLKKTRLVVSCICERYGEKPWTQDEWRAIQAFERDLRDADTENVKRMRFLPLRFDDGEVAGIYSTAIVPDVRNRTAEEIADLILARLELASINTLSGGRDAVQTVPNSESSDNGKQSAHSGKATIRYRVPELPLPYHSRSRRNTSIGRWLWQRTRSRDSSPIAITGPSGVGKSVIAAAICKSNAVGAMFPDGIVWLDCSHHWELQSSLEAVLTAITGEARSIGDIIDGVSALRGHTHFRNTLVVFDNLDDPEIARILAPLAQTCPLLVTTSNSKAAHTLRCRSSQLKPFSLWDGVRLLKLASRVQPNDVEYLDFQTTVRQCGYLPSLIVEAGLLIRSQPNSWHQYLNDDIEQRDEQQVPFSDRLFNATTVGLNEIEAHCFCQLVVFEPSDVITESVLETLWWGLPKSVHWRTVLQSFVDRNLLVRRASPQGSYKVRGIHLTALRKQDNDVVTRHSCLLDNYLARFSSWQAVPFDGYFERRILDHMKMAHRHAESKDVAYFILACPNDITAEAARKCFKVLGERADDQALTILSATDDPLLQQTCLLHLGAKARLHASRLLRKTTNRPLKALCISLLGEEASEEADRLLADNANAVLILTCLNHASKLSHSRLKQIFQASDNPEVQIKCVRMMNGVLQQQCATHMLTRSSNPSAIIECLKICGDVADSVAQKILETHENENVRVACLRKIGKHDKIIARKFLKESEHDYILCWCLGRLGREAKPMAKRLVRQPRGFQLICKALRLLGKDGREDAIYLLQASNDPRVLIASLQRLESAEAIPFARKLLDDVVECRLDSLVAVRCIRILGADAKPAARELIKRDEKSEVLIACIDALGTEAIGRIQQIAQTTKNPIVVQKCLEHLQSQGIETAREWQHKTRSVQLIRLCKKIIDATARK